MEAFLSLIQDAQVRSRVASLTARDGGNAGNAGAIASEILVKRKFEFPSVIKNYCKTCLSIKKRGLSPIN